MTDAFPTPGANFLSVLRPVRGTSRASPRSWAKQDSMCEMTSVGVPAQWSPGPGPEGSA